jgi:hypothetical protein
MSSIMRASQAAQARQLAARGAPAERPLAYCRQSDGEFAIATDKRVIGVRTRSGPPYSWSMRYSEVTSFGPGDKKHRRLVTLHAGRRIQRIEVGILLTEDEGLDYQKHHQAALLVILARKTRSEPASAPDPPMS